MVSPYVFTLRRVHPCLSRNHHRPLLSIRHVHSKSRTALSSQQQLPRTMPLQRSTDPLVWIDCEVTITITRHHHNTTEWARANRCRNICHVDDRPRPPNRPHPPNQLLPNGQQPRASRPTRLRNHHPRPLKHPLPNVPLVHRDPFPNGANQSRSRLNHHPGTSLARFTQLHPAVHPKAPDGAFGRKQRSRR